MPSTALKLTPDQIDNLKQFGLDVGKGLVGETPSEWAFNAAMLPMGPVPRAAAMGASAMLRSSDSEANLARLATYVPARLEKLYEFAKKLREAGRGSEIWKQTEGKLTQNPEKEIEAIYKPKSMAYGKLGEKPTTFSDLLEYPDLLKDYPEVAKLFAKTEPISGGAFRRGAPEGPTAVVGNKYKDRAEISELLGHETQHGFDFLHGYPYGSSIRSEELRIADFIRQFNAVPEKQLSTTAKIRAELLRKKLGTSDAAEDLYGRNLAETRARAAGDVWRYANDMDPYKGSNVLRPFTASREGELEVGKTAYERIMNKSSPVYTGDLWDTISELKQTK